MTPDELVLSLFPGVGLLDRAFTEAGFCVVQGPDLITGGDIRNFRGIMRSVDGIIAGPPCQGFSVANTYRMDPTHPSVINSREMLCETCRVINECGPRWFLIENVPCVPDVRIRGYKVQRIPITDDECGGMQLRSRHIQFGSLTGLIIRPKRVATSIRNRHGKRKTPKSITTKTDAATDFADLYRSQGLAEPLKLDGWYRYAMFKAVGNGVPLTMGRILAEAVANRSEPDPQHDCQCGCGRTVSKRAKTATPACRKRKQMASVPYPWIDEEGYHE